MSSGGAVAQLGARLDGIEEVVGSNPIGSTKNHKKFNILVAVFGLREPGSRFCARDQNSQSAPIGGSLVNNPLNSLTP
jgi:hypothetical protein